MQHGTVLRWCNFVPRAAARRVGADNLYFFCKGLVQRWRACGVGVLEVSSLASVRSGVELVQGCGVLAGMGHLSCIFTSLAVLAAGDWGMELQPGVFQPGKTNTRRSSASVRVADSAGQLVDPSPFCARRATGATHPAGRGIKSSE
jgi:hypothetical protein